MRRLAVMLLATGLVATSCSSGSNDDEASNATPPPVAAAPTEPATTDAATTEPVTTEPVTTDTTLADTPVVVPDGATAYEQLENLRATGTELEVALAEVAAIVGPLPGVPQLIDDGTVYPSLTHAMATIDQERSALAPETAAAVDAALAEIFDPASIAVEFALFEDAAPSGAGDESDSGPEGFAGRGLRSNSTLRGSEPVGVDAPESVQRLVRGIGEELRSVLGGPPLNIWVQIFPPGAFGGDAARNTGLIPTNPLRDDFPTRPDCLLRLAVGATSSDIAGIVAHEITHCWQFTRLGFDAVRFEAMSDWANEGMAAYIGEQFGGRTRYNAEWWGGYLTTRIDLDGQWNMYERTYDAIGFWSRIAESGDVVAAMRRTVDAAPSDSRMFAAATRDLGVDTSWLGAGTFQRADWGGGWTAAGPGLPGTARTASRHTVIERNDIALSTDAGAQSNHEIEVSPLPGVDGTVLTIAGAGRGVLRVDPDDVVLAGSFTEEWCLGNCACPDGTPAFPADRIEPGAIEVAASLVGQASESTTLRARVDEFDPEAPDRCDEEPEPAPAPPPSGDVDGLIGTWRASPESVAAVFEQASAFGPEATGFEVSGAAGRVLMTFADDGTGSLTYDSVTLFLVDQIIGDLTISGSGTFAWSIVGGNVQISGTDFAYGVSSQALGGELLVITDEDVPTSGSTTLSGGVSGDSLIFASADGSEGRVFFPTTWSRQQE